MKVIQRSAFVVIFRRNLYLMNMAWAVAKLIREISYSNSFISLISLGASREKEGSFNSECAKSFISEAYLQSLQSREYAIHSSPFACFACSLDVVALVAVLPTLRPYISRRGRVRFDPLSQRVRCRRRGALIRALLSCRLS